MKDLSIRNKVRLSFGILTGFVLISSILSIIFVSNINERVDDLYNHPFTVTSASRKVEIYALEEIRVIHPILHEEGDLVLMRLSVINLHADVQDDLLILDNNYLGPMTDINEIKVAYNTVYNKTLEAIQLAEEGDYDGAREVYDQINEIHLPVLTDETQDVIDFANNKAIEFSEQADRINSNYIYIITVASFLMIISAITLFILMLKDIFPAIEKLINTINSFKDGEGKMTLDIERKDEIGYIGKSFSEMLKNIKTQQEIEALDLKLSNLRNRENLRITLMSIGDGVITTDLNAKITNINPVALHLLGLTYEEAIGEDVTKVMEMFNKHTGEKVPNPVLKVIGKRQSVKLEKDTVLKSKKGTEYEISDSASPIMDETGKIFGVVLVFRDMTTEFITRREVEYLSFHDRLTGIYNRNYLENKFLDLEQSNDKDVAVIMGDVNGLKITNDAFGHKFGDMLLQEISTILELSSPMEKTHLVRWGGDEFVIIVEQTNREEVEQITKRIIDNCLTFESNSPVVPSISLGYALKTSTDQNLYRTLIRAEDMMYENKLTEKDSLRNTIVQSLQTSLFEKSYETEEHANRVAQYSGLIAKELNLPQNEVNNVILLSRLHDIGKISIDDEILQKRGKLNSEEWKIIKKHPETGYRIASSLNELTHIADGILSHHEHYDGGGYPRKLKGKDIPLNARIVAIADAYDVMTSDRAYKKSMSKVKAIQELVQCRGTQFDPEIIDIFLQILNKEE